MLSFSSLRSSVVSRVKSVISAGRKFSSTATENSNLPTSYSAPMQIMHWTVGGSIVACVALVNVAQFYKGKEKMEIMFYHKSFGLLAAGLVVPRLLLRAVSKVPAEVPGAMWEVLAAKASHGLLYGFMVFMPLTGVLMGYYGGKGLPFFTTTVKGAEVADGKVAGTAFKAHKLVGHYAQYLIPVHVGAVGYHSLIKGKSIIPRMFGSAGK
jgi:cytochrome b561